jgi:hypothetical protein
MIRCPGNTTLHIDVKILPRYLCLCEVLDISRGSRENIRFHCILHLLYNLDERFVLYLQLCEFLTDLQSVWFFGTVKHL